MKHKCSSYKPPSEYNPATDALHKDNKSISGHKYTHDVYMKLRSHLLYNLFPDQTSSDSLCRQQLLVTGCQVLGIRRSLQTNDFEDDLQVTPSWPQHERIPRPNRRYESHEVHGRGSLTERMHVLLFLPLSIGFYFVTIIFFFLFSKIL